MYVCAMICVVSLSQNHLVVAQLVGVLESSVFTADVDTRVLEIFQQFQALL